MSTKISIKLSITKLFKSYSMCQL